MVDRAAVALNLSRPFKQKRPPSGGRQIADKGLAPGEAFVFNSGMLKRPTPAQHELEMVTLE
ncbi:hypothetical protein ACQUJO_13205, partial [Ralstonia pseudosolanacearum]